MINKKIASEVAVGIVLIVALIVGAIFWMQNKENESIEFQASEVKNNPVAIDDTLSTENIADLTNESEDVIKVEDIVANILENSSLKNGEKSVSPGVLWRRGEDNKFICLNTSASDYYFDIVGKNNIDSKMLGIVNYLKKDGFIENKYNFLKNNKIENDPSSIGLEKGNIKCKLTKQVNDIKKDISKSKYSLEISCADLTKKDQENFDNFYDKVYEMGNSPIVCIEKSNENYLTGGIGAYDEEVGRTAGATFYGKKINNEWKLFISNDVPPCSFVDGFAKDVFSGLCFDGKVERQSR